MGWLFKPGTPFKQLSADLNRHYKEIMNGGGESFYLIFGEESFLVHRITKRLITAFTAQDESDGESVKLLEGDEATDVSISKAVLSCPMSVLFGRRYLVVARNPSLSELQPQSTTTRGRRTKTPQKASTHLINIIERGLPIGVVLIISVDAPLEMEHPLVQVALKHGCAIYFSKLKRYELVTFVEWVCKRLGIQMERDAIQELLMRVGEDLWQINSEVEKLTAYIGERGKVTLDDVRELVPSLSGDVFKLTELLVHGSIDDARSLMSSLLSRGEPLAKILYMLARHYRLLIQARWLLEKRIITRQHIETLELEWRERSGYEHDLKERLQAKLTEEARSKLPDGERLSLLAQHPYVIKMLLSQSELYTLPKLMNALSVLHDADVALKTGGSAKDEEIADWLVIRLCQVAKSH
jgi:DNA polymerase-3 subunit delta